MTTADTKRSSSPSISLTRVMGMVALLAILVLFVGPSITSLFDDSGQVILWVPEACDDPVPVDVGSTEGGFEGISTSVGQEGDKFRLTYYDGEEAFLITCPLEMRMRPIEVTGS